jgi:hypothetical protein
VGQMMQATCPCGFTSDEMLIGGGMQNYGSYCLMPAACVQCKTIIAADYFGEPEPTCGTCGTPLFFYIERQPQRRSAVTDDPVTETADAGRHREWVSPAEDSCLCPACGENTLNFAMTGLWD